MSLIKIWKEKGKIMEGILNYVFKHQDVEIIANERQKECDACEYHDIKGKTCMIPGTGPCCELCGCVIKIKIRSLSSCCPDSRWEAMMTEEEEDLLNEQL